MSFSNYFKRFFGFRDEKSDESSPNRQHGNKPVPRNEFRNPIWGSGEDDGYDDEDEIDMSIAPYGFSVFSNPLEFHRIIDHNMKIFQKSMEQFQSEMSRAFGLFDGPSLHDDHMLPSLPEIEESSPNFGGEKEPSSIRDQYLKPEKGKELHPMKPGFIPWSDGQDKQDINLDDRIQGDDVGKFLDNLPNPGKQDLRPSFTPRSFFEGFSSSSSVSINNGKVLHKSVKTDSHGRKVTTVTKRMGDQEHSIVTTTDKDGNNTIEENFVNLDQETLGDFEKKWNTQSASSFQPRNSPDISFPDFSRWFK